MICAGTCYAIENSVTAACKQATQRGLHVYWDGNYLSCFVLKGSWRTIFSGANISVNN
jgi:hypothetical protein